MSRTASACRIDHLQLQRFAGFALQQIAPVQAVKLLVCQPDQIIQRQPPGEFAEPIAGAGADQRVEIAPVIRQLRRLCNLPPQRLLMLTALCVLPELLADLARRVVLSRSRWASRAAEFAGRGCPRPSRADAAPVRLLLPGRLLAERRRLLKLLLQRLF